MILIIMIYSPLLLAMFGRPLMHQQLRFFYLAGSHYCWRAYKIDESCSLNFDEAFLHQI